MELTIEQIYQLLVVEEGFCVYEMSDDEWGVWHDDFEIVVRQCPTSDDALMECYRWWNNYRKRHEKE